MYFPSFRRREAYLEPSQTSTVGVFFVKMKTNFQLITIFAKKDPSHMFEWGKNTLLSY